MQRMFAVMALVLTFPLFLASPAAAAPPTSAAHLDVARLTSALNGRPKLPDQGATGTPTVDDLLARVETFDNLSREHTEGPVEYAQIPPVGGMHNPVLQNCGFYSKPVGNEHAVHSLEH